MFLFVTHRAARCILRARVAFPNTSLCSPRRNPILLPTVYQYVPKTLVSRPERLKGHVFVRGVIQCFYLPERPSHRARHPLPPHSLSSLLNQTAARTLLLCFCVRSPTLKLGGRGLEPSVEETVACPAPDGVLAEAAHPAGAGEEGSRHVHRPTRAQVNTIAC